MDSTELVPEFFKLMREAFNASEAVDYFDLRSEDKASADRFAALISRGTMTTKRLVAFCRDHHDQLQVGLDELAEL